MMSEVWSPKFWSLKTEIWSPKSEVRSLKSEDTYGKREVSSDFRRIAVYCESTIIHWHQLSWVLQTQLANN